MAEQGEGMLPLALASEGSTVRVAMVKGDSDLRQHLAELGFVEGAEVKVFAHTGGDCIVSVKGSRFALNRSMANHVMVTP